MKNSNQPTNDLPLNITFNALDIILPIENLFDFAARPFVFTYIDFVFKETAFDFEKLFRPFPAQATQQLFLYPS